jgi:hypothetical protein
MKVLEVIALLQNISPGNSAWRRNTNATTLKFNSSLLIKLVTDKTSSLLTHDSSEQLSPLDCMCHQNDSQRLSTFELPLVHLDLNEDCDEELVTAGLWNHTTP